MKLSTSRLRWWSYVIRCRDGWACQMCLRPHAPTLERRCEAHHIWPKALYPAKAYNLRNGITLCWRCHRQVVHRGPIESRSWRKFVPLWSGYMRRREIQSYHDFARRGFVSRREFRRRVRAYRKAHPGGAYVLGSGSLRPAHTDTILDHNQRSTHADRT